MVRKCFFLISYHIGMVEQSVKPYNTREINVINIVIIYILYYIYNIYYINVVN